MGAPLSKPSRPFERIENRFDPLPDPTQLPKPLWFVVAIWTHQLGAKIVGNTYLGVLASKPIIPDDDLAGTDQMMGMPSGCADHRYAFGLTIRLRSGNYRSIPVHVHL
ncbi:MAG: hypothetical protein L0I94_12945 [Yaniella sp.]|nr:hypothetical protein [Yaniella sp.]